MVAKKFKILFAEFDFNFSADSQLVGHHPTLPSSEICGAIEDTVIEAGVKLDNQIQIGHNVRVGAHTVMAGCAAVAGSTSIGRHCKIGGGVGIVGHVEICDGVTITARTLVTKSIREAGVFSGGLPHMGNREWLKMTAHIRRIEQLLGRVEQLEQQIADITHGRAE